MKVCIIIPAYNEESNLTHLIPKIVQEGYDYLVVNDCSTDNTGKILDEYNFNHLDLSANIGLAGVTQLGFMYAYEHDYDVAIVIDGDGQHPPMYIKELLNAIDQGYDYVVGSRFINKKKPMNLRMIGSRILSCAIWIKTQKKVTDPTSGMRALGKSVLKEFSYKMNFIAEPDALVHILRRKYKYCETAVEMEDRSKGVSYFGNPLKSIKFMCSVCISILFVQW